MKAITPVIVCSFVVLLSASPGFAQSYFRSSSQSWNSSYNSATDNAPKTSYSHSEGGWGGGGWGGSTQDYFPEFRKTQVPTWSKAMIGENGPPSLGKIWRVPMIGEDGPSQGAVDKNHFSFVNVPIGQLLRDVARLSSKNVRLTREAWKKIQESSKTISLKVSNVSAKQLMEAVVKDLGLVITRNDNSVVISIDSDADKASESFQLEELVKLSFMKRVDSMKLSPIFMSPFDFNPKLQFDFSFIPDFLR